MGRWRVLGEQELRATLTFCPSLDRGCVSRAPARWGDYKCPAADVPGTWKGEGPLQVAAPKDSIPKENWWELYRDAELNELEQQLLQANQSLKSAQDRLLQAGPSARVASAGFFPILSADPNGERERFSGNRPLQGANPAQVHPDTENNFVVPFAPNQRERAPKPGRRPMHRCKSERCQLAMCARRFSAELVVDYFNLREVGINRP